jgi:fission process protein 1
VNRAGESTESNLRYAGYAARIRTILLSAHRYVAYTSDIGESFRPVAHPWLVRSAYGISWAYIGGDVAHEGYKAYIKNQKILHPEKEAEKDKADGKESATLAKKDLTPGHVPAIEDYRAVMVQRAIFQTLASMGLPAFTIHSIVRYSGKALKNAKNTTIRTYGPIGVSSAHLLYSSRGTLIQPWTVGPCCSTSTTIPLR